MQQHDIDTFIAMAQRQHNQEPSVPFAWVATAMKYAYNLGFDEGAEDALAELDPWEHEDDIPF